MPTYTAITSAEIDEDSPITESVLTRLRDNPIAISEGASGAPRIQTAAIATGAVTYAKLATAAINTLNSYADGKAFTSQVLYEGTLASGSTATFPSSRTINDYDLISVEVQNSADNWVYYMFARAYIRLGKDYILTTKTGGSSNGHSEVDFPSATQVRYYDVNVSANLKRVVGHKTTD